MLNDFLYDGYGKGIFAHVNSHMIVTSLGDRTVLRPIKEIGIINQSGISLNEYFRLISEGKYSAIFFDYSLLSVESIFLDNNILRHRYIYIPCPIKKELTEKRPEEVEIYDYLQQINLDNMRDSIISQGYLRFDYTTDEPPENTYHPASHLTFISSDCRIGLRSPISIASFFTFIFENFYPDKIATWLKYQPHLNLSYEDCIRDHETSRMHLHWTAAAF